MAVSGPSAWIELSPHTLALLDECPACFWRHYHGLRRPERPVATITTGPDRVIKAYVDRYRPELPPLLAGKLPGRLVSRRPRRLVWEDPKERLTIVGFPDDLLELDDGRVIPLDHKTRGQVPEEIHPAYQLQLDCYAFLLEGQGSPPVSFGFLVYYIPQPGPLHQGFPFAVEGRELTVSAPRARTLAAQGASLVRQSTPPTSSPACVFCRYVLEVGSIGLTRAAKGRKPLVEDSRQVERGRSLCGGWP